MGSGIAQIAWLPLARAKVRLFDKNYEAGAQAMLNIQNSVNKLVEKGKLSPSEGCSDGQDLSV